VSTLSAAATGGEHNSIQLELAATPQAQPEANHITPSLRPKHAQDGVTKQDVTDTCRATLQKLITAADKLGPTEEGTSLTPLERARFVGTVKADRMSWSCQTAPGPPSSSCLTTWPKCRKA
jgi:hypothetical protein